jgi:hypothetical protein
MSGDPFGMIDDDEDFGEEGEGPEGLENEDGGSTEPEAGGDDTGGGGWDEIEAQQGAVKKSLGSRGAVRIVI